MAKTVRIEEIRGCEGNCITINDTRIAGPKPWGGGYVIKKWDARVDHILKALGADVAEVVRCKDCMCCRGAESTENRALECFNPLGLPIITPDTYCAYGERREET